MKTKEFIVTLLFIFSVLIVYGIFPAKGSFQQLIVMGVFFCALPIIFNKVILKRTLGDIGVAVGDWEQGLAWSGVCVFVASLLFFVVIYFFGFLKHYTIPSTIIHDYKNFLFYEFILILPVVLIYDFFFRGFVMLTLGIRTHYWAIAIQTLVFLVLVAATKSFAWALVPYLISAPLAGVITYKSRSIFYSTTFQLIAIIILDASIVRLVR
jgi:membrane protease YdiL (CAAX protease family)